MFVDGRESSNLHTDNYTQFHLFGIIPIPICIGELPVVTEALTSSSLSFINFPSNRFPPRANRSSASRLDLKQKQKEETVLNRTLERNGPF